MNRPHLFFFHKLPSLFYFFLAVSFALTSCSKDKRVERALYKKEGSWTISSVSWNTTVQDTSGQSFNSGTTNNAGAFTFDKDGSAGTYNFTVNGNTYSRSFNWSVNDEIVSITQIEQNIFAGFSQIAVSMSGEQTGKKSLTMKGSIVEQYFSGSISQKSFTGTFYLSKD